MVWFAFLESSATLLSGSTIVETTVDGIRCIMVVMMREYFDDYIYIVRMRRWQTANVDGRMWDKLQLQLGRAASPPMIPRRNKKLFCTHSNVK